MNQGLATKNTKSAKTEILPDPRGWAVNMKSVRKILLRSSRHGAGQTFFVLLVLFVAIP
jgi:hypothetical protein